MITRRGIGITVTAVAIFFLASVTRVGWLHLADAVLWAMIVVGAGLPWLAVAGLRATRRIETGGGRDGIGPVVGDRVEVAVEIENRWPAPRFLATASYESSLTAGERERQRVFFAHLPGSSTTAGANVVACNVRGRHELGPLTIESAAPFGLFRRKRQVAAPFSLLVYPRWHRMTRVGLLEARRGETEGRRPVRSGTEMMAARRYGAGDPMRDVHWKNTARTGRLMIKEYDAGSDDSVVIAFDTSNPEGEGEETTLEYAVSIAASASRALVRNNHAVAIAAGGPAGPATADWRRIMEALALVEPRRERALANAVATLPGNARVLAIVSADDTVSVKALASLALRGAGVAAVVLSGFGDARRGGLAAVATLRAAGIVATECRRGGLEACIDEMETGAVARASARPGAALRDMATPVTGREAA